MAGLLNRFAEHLRGFLASDEYDRRVQEALQGLPDTDETPEWIADLTSPHERARIKEQGRALARERFRLSAEVRVIARQYGVDV